MQFRLAPNLSFYRVVLPIELAPGRFSQEGTWHVLLGIGKPRLKRPDPVGPTVRTGSGVLEERCQEQWRRCRRSANCAASSGLRP